MPKSPEYHLQELIKFFRSHDQEIPGVDDLDSFVALLALAEIKKILERKQDKKPKIEHRTEDPWDIALDVAEQCRVNGIIQLEQLSASIKRISFVTRGKQYSKLTNYMNKILDGIQKHGADSIFQLALPVILMNILIEADIRTVSALKSHLMGGKLKSIRGIGPKFEMAITEALDHHPFTKD